MDASGSFSLTGVSAARQQNSFVTRKPLTSAFKWFFSATVRVSIQFVAEASGLFALAGVSATTFEENHGVPLKRFFIANGTLKSLLLRLNPTFWPR